MLTRDASEADFQSVVMALAKQYGWLTFQASPHQVGKPTTVGSPDGDWGDALSPHVEWYCWRPSQLQLIAKRLSGS